MTLYNVSSANVFQKISYFMYQNKCIPSQIALIFCLSVLEICKRLKDNPYTQHRHSFRSKRFHSRKCKASEDTDEDNCKFTLHSSQ